jgi:hypothetical protein
MTHEEINTFVLLLVAALNAWTAWQLRHIERKVGQAADDIQRVETATNSMKDALVAATAKASHAEGVEQGRLEVRPT